MNFSWEMVLHLQQQGIKKEDLFFKQAKEYSPYYEQSFQDINQTQITAKVLEINSFLRFAPIFERLLDQNAADHAELKQYLFDVLMHYLIEIDLYQGLSERELSVRKLCQELAQAHYGTSVAKQFGSLPAPLRYQIGDALLTQFQTGASVYLFSQMIRILFPKAIVYKNQLIAKQLLIYLGEREGEAVIGKTELVTALFLPIGYGLRWFYKHHFGILDIEETLLLGDIEIF